METNNTRPEKIVNSKGILTTVHKKAAEVTQGTHASRSAEKVKGASVTKMTADYSQVRDIMGDTVVDTSSRAEALSLFKIAQSIIGFDPSIGKATADFGGKTKEGCFSEHISVPSIRKALDQLEEDGTITAVKKGSYNAPSEDEKLIKFSYGYRSGYVMTSNLEEARAMRDAEDREKKVAKLRQEAVEIVAARYSDEVDEITQRLTKEAGL